MADRVRKVVSLIRVSTPGQEDKHGPERQQEDIDRWCAKEKHNLKVVKTYPITVSGADVQHSAEFARMLSDVKNKPEIAGVVFSVFDRFFRPDDLGAYQIFDAFKKHGGKKLFCDLGELDPHKNEDRLRIIIYGEMAGQDRARISDRLQRAREDARHKADKSIDELPKGVAYSKETKLFSYTDFAQNIKEAYDLVDIGETYSDVARATGFKSHTSLVKSLKSQWWIGNKAYIYHRKAGEWDKEKDKRPDGKRVLRTTPIEVRTNLADEPLISRDLWDRVQARLAKKPETYLTRKSRTNDFLVAGLAYCECGQRLYHKVDNRNGKPQYYRCASYHQSNFNQTKKGCGASSFSGPVVDRLVWATFLMTTKSQKALEDQIKSQTAGETPDAGKIKRLGDQLKKLTHRLEVNTEMMEDEGRTPALLARRKAIQTEITAATTELASLTATKVDYTKQAAGILKTVKLANIHRTMTIQQKKDLLAAVVKKAFIIPVVHDLIDVPILTGDETESELKKIIAIQEKGGEPGLTVRLEFR